MSESTHPHRRHFLQGAALGVAAATVTGTSLASAADANQRVRVALIGCGDRGKYLADIFAKRNDVELAYVADCHQKRLVVAAKQFQGAKAVGDYRTVLDDPAVDAVILATPVHWHAPGTIVACEAGKHVYVEKPCSHNVREGRLIVEASQRNKRVVQHGTQVRNTSTIQAGIQLLHDGIIGEVLQAKRMKYAG
jgi:predicted dehydrogenase